MSQSLEGTKKLMGALVRMKPKPHEKMKIGKPVKKTRKKRASKLPAKHHL
jgi:hypothetical protein